MSETDKIRHFSHDSFSIYITGFISTCNSRVLVLFYFVKSSNFQRYCVQIYERNRLVRNYYLVSNSTIFCSNVLIKF